MITKLRKRYTLPGLIICLLGLVLLWVLFTFWLFDTNYSLWAYIASFLSVALFVLVCLRFVPGWMRYWSHGVCAVESDRVGGEPERIRAIIFVIGLLFCIAVFAVTYLIYIACGYSGTWASFCNFWTLTDSQHYLDIARDWYLSEGVIDRLV